MPTVHCNLILVPTQLNNFTHKFRVAIIVPLFRLECVVILTHGNFKKVIPDLGWDPSNKTGGDHPHGSAAQISN